MRVVFDSDQMPSGLSPLEKARAWAAAMEQVGAHFDARCSRRGFSAKLTCTAVADVALGWASATSVVVERSKRRTGDGDDRIHLLVNDGGGTLFGRQSGRESEWTEGAGAFFCYTKASTTGAHFGGSALSILLPRKRLGQALGQIENRLCRPVAPDTEALRLLRRYTSAVVSETDFSGGLADSIANHIVDLAILSVGAEGTDAAQARERGLPAARLAAVMTAIAARCHEPGLTAGDIGAALGISARYIQHLMQGHSTTFSEELTKCRLDLAHRRLTEHGLAEGSIADIAFASGFNDLSTFYRAFRARFGCTPGDVCESE